jgi:hypothetical protein
MLRLKSRRFSIVKCSERTAAAKVPIRSTAGRVSIDCLGAVLIYLFPNESRSLLLRVIKGTHHRLTPHRKNDAELCLAAQHAFITLCCFFEWISLNHWAHARQLSEAQSVVLIRWRT